MALSLGQMLGWGGNPIYDAVSPYKNTIATAGLGLMSGRNWTEGFQNAARGAVAGNQVDDVYKQHQAEEAEKQSQLNYTIEAMQREGFQDLVDAANAGVPIGTLYNEYWRRKFGAGDSNNVTYGVTPIWGQFEDGRFGYGVQGTDGSFKPVDTGGMTPLDPRSLNTERAAGTVIGKNEANMDIQAPVMEANLTRLDAQTDNVIAAVDKALGQASWDTTGIVGQALGNFAGTGAFDLRETAKTIKANLGFAELQAMRDASPTGGALGQVAVQELEALQSTLASLNPDQSEQQLRENLKTVRDLLERQKMYRRMAMEAKTGTAAPATVGDDIDGILRGYGL